MAYQLQQYGLLDHHYASSSPAPSAIASQEDLLRPMNLRILYTFDLRADGQYLAKSPRAIPVQTVAMADGSQIGLTSLKTCLQAILRASPEIYSEETDYTVYAFDPSEQGTPRVGHGRLSQIIKQNSQEEEDPVLVTGIVKNNLTLLATSQQVQDNLEIRLCLTPVANRGQNESGSRSPYIEERAPSPRVSGYPDVGDLLNRLNPQLLMLLQQQQNSSTNAKVDPLQKFLANNFFSSEQSRPSTSNNSAPFLQLQTASSRPGSPALSTASNASTNLGSRTLKRTASAISRSASYVSDIPSTLSQADGYGSGEDSHPKRVRATQVQRPNKNVANKKGDLRMVASSAASLRVHQPTAVRPQEHSAQNLEDPPRVPTPVPQYSDFSQRRPSLAARSRLHTETSFSQLSESRSPVSEANLPSLPNSTATSPEAHFHPLRTPEDIASSPPVIPVADDYPSSPALPPLHEDSGFMSGGGLVDHSEAENEEPEDQSPEPGTMLPPAKRQRPLQSAANRPATVLQDTTANELSRRKALNAMGHKTTPPTSANSSPVVKRPQGRPRGRPDSSNDKHPTSWDKEKRRQAMITKLQTSIQNGEVPPYCYNCGAIETPSWRKAFTKVFAGEAPTLLVPKGGVKEDGAIIGCEVIEVQPETGKSAMFRIYKKNLLATDENFDLISLCNPCGLWLKNRGINRPEKLWHRTAEREERRKMDPIEQREKRPRVARGDEGPQSDITDMTTLGMRDQSESAVHNPLRGVQAPQSDITGMISDASATQGLARGSLEPQPDLSGMVFRRTDSRPQSRGSQEPQPDLSGMVLSRTGSRPSTRGGLEPPQNPLGIMSSKSGSRPPSRGSQEPQSETTSTIIGMPGMMRLPPNLFNPLLPMSEPPMPVEDVTEEPGSTHRGSTTHGSHGINGMEEMNGSQSRSSGAQITPTNCSISAKGGTAKSSPVRRSLFSSPRSSGPLGVDIPAKNALYHGQTSDSNVGTLEASSEDIVSNGPLIDLETNNSSATPSGQSSLLGDTSTESSSTVVANSCPLTPTKQKALQLPPVTPSHGSASREASFSKTPSNLFRTPAKQTPSQRITASDFFSASAKKLLHGAATNMTPSRIGASPELLRLARQMYGNSPTDFSDLFDQIDNLEMDCCVDNPEHDEDCPRRLLDPRLTEGLDLPMLNGIDFTDPNFGSDFPANDEDWANADAFFRSSGITGFTPMKQTQQRSIEEDDVQEEAAL